MPLDPNALRSTDYATDNGPETTYAPTLPADPTLGVGTSSFLRGAKSALYGQSANALAGDALDAQRAGDATQAAALRAQADEHAAIAQQTAPAIRSLRDIHGVGDAVDFATGQIGAAAPVMAPAIAGAVVGRGLLRISPSSLAGALLKTGGAGAGELGAHVLPAVTFYLQSRDALIRAQDEDPVQAAADPDQRLDVARKYGAVQAVGASLFPAAATRIPFTKGVGSTLARDAALQGGVGYGTALLSHAAGAELNPNRDTSHDSQEALDAAAGNALVGGAFGLPHALAAKGYSTAERVVRPAVENAKAITERLPEHIAGLSQGIQDTVRDGLQALRDGVPDKVDAIQAALKQTYEQADAAARPALRTAMEYLGKKYDEVRPQVSDDFPEWVKKAQAVGGSVRDNIKAYAERILAAGRGSEYADDAKFLREGLSQATNLDETHAVRTKMRAVIDKWAPEAGATDRNGVLDYLDKKVAGAPINAATTAAKDLAIKGGFGAGKGTGYAVDAFRLAMQQFDTGRKALSAKLDALRSSKKPDEDSQARANEQEVDTSKLKDAVFAELKPEFQNTEGLARLKSVVQLTTMIAKNADEVKPRHLVQHGLASSWDSIMADPAGAAERIGKVLGVPIKDLFDGPSTLTRDANVGGSAFDAALTKDAQRVLSKSERAELAKRVEDFMRGVSDKNEGRGLTQKGAFDVPAAQSDEYAAALHTFAPFFTDLRALIDHYAERYGVKPKQHGLYESLAKANEEHFGQDHEDQLTEHDAPESQTRLKSGVAERPYFEHEGRARIAEMSKEEGGVPGTHELLPYGQHLIDRGATPGELAAKRASYLEDIRARLKKGGQPPETEARMRQVLAAEKGLNDRQVLDIGHVIRTHGVESSDQVASDADLRSMTRGARIKSADLRTNPHAAHLNDARQKPLFFIKLGGNKLTFSADSIRQTWASKGHQYLADETRAHYSMRMFQEGLAAIMARHDYRELSGLTDSTVIDRKMGLTFGDAKNYNPWAEHSNAPVETHSMFEKNKKEQYGWKTNADKYNFYQKAIEREVLDKRYGIAHANAQRAMKNSDDRVVKDFYGHLLERGVKREEETRRTDIDYEGKPVERKTDTGLTDTTTMSEAAARKRGDNLTRLNLEDNPESESGKRNFDEVNQVDVRGDQRVVAPIRGDEVARKQLEAAHEEQPLQKPGIEMRGAKTPALPEGARAARAGNELPTHMSLPESKPAEAPRVAPKATAKVDDAGAQAHNKALGLNPDGTAKDSAPQTKDAKLAAKLGAGPIEKLNNKFDSIMSDHAVSAALNEALREVERLTGVKGSKALGNGSMFAVKNGREIVALSAAAFAKDRALGLREMHHEIMHLVLNRIAAVHGEEVARKLVEAAQSKHIRDQVLALADKEAAREYYMDNPEEMFVQAYAEWTQGRLTLTADPKLRTFFARMKAVVQALFGKLSGDPLLAEVFHSVKQGEIRELLKQASPDDLTRMHLAHAHDPNYITYFQREIPAGFEAKLDARIAKTLEMMGSKAADYKDIIEYIRENATDNKDYNALRGLSHTLATIRDGEPGALSNLRGIAQYLRNLESHRTEMFAQHRPEHDKTLNELKDTTSFPKIRELAGPELWDKVREHITTGVLIGIEKAIDWAGEREIRKILEDNVASDTREEAAAKLGAPKTKDEAKVAEAERVNLNKQETAKLAGKDYPEYSAFTAERTTPPSAEEKAAAIADLHRMLGPKIEARLKDTTLFSGKFEKLSDAERITLSTLALAPLGQVAAHEALHVFMSRLMGSDAVQRDVRNTLNRVADSGRIIRQLRELLKDHPEALKQIEGDSPIAREERVAYMFQFWSHGALKMGPETHGVFQKIAAWIRKLVGVVTGHEKAEGFMRALYDGKFADPSTVTKVVEGLKLETARDKAQRIAPRIVGTINKLGAAATDRLRQPGIDAFDEIANGFHRDPDREGGGGLGMLQRTAQQHGKFLNTFQDIIAKASPEEIKTSLAGLQAMKPGNDRVTQQVRSLLDNALKYMREAGVERKRSYEELLKMNDGKPDSYDNLAQRYGATEPFGEVKDYFPRAWAGDTIARDISGFAKDLNEHGGLPLEKAQEIAEGMARVTPGATDLAESEHAPGFTPFNQALNQRALKFITPENAHIFAKWQKQDMVEIMSTYLHQAAHRGEYARTFGNDGEKIQALMAQAKKQGATREELAMAGKAVRAMEGTLGASMDPKWRARQSAALVAENVILLPLSLFSSLIDPLGIAIRSGDAVEAWTGFKTGMKGIADDIARRPKGKDYEMARTIGLIDQANMLENYGNLYNGMYMSRFLKNVNTKFFKWNGMESWNNNMRVAAMVAGERFLIAHAKDVDAEHSARFLKELGVTKDDIKPQSDGRLATSVAHGLTEQQEAKIHAALFRFVDDAILRPNAAHRSLWGSDPHYAFIFHLKQFTFSFHNVIMRRIAHETDAGNEAVMKIAALYVPFMWAVDYSEDALVGVGLHKGAGLAAHAWRSITRAGVLGKWQYAADAVLDPFEGKIPGESFAGPLVQHGLKVGRYLAGQTDGKSTLYRSLPAGSLLRSATS